MVNYEKILAAINELQACLEEAHQETIEDEDENHAETEPNCSYCAAIAEGKQLLQAAGFKSTTYHTMSV